MRFAPAVAALLGGLALAAGAAEPTGRNIVLVTLDGVRIQELFTGMDPVIANATEAESGIYDASITRARYWRESPIERREALMPFFWKTLVPAGLVLGNPALGSPVTVRNTQWFSYPGYSEILTEVAQIGSRDGFKYAASQKNGPFFMSGAYDPVPAEFSTPEMDELAALRPEVLQLWEESSNDTLTFRLALSYLKRHQPRVLWLGFGQSDDWAHARRYDRLLDYLQLVDRHLSQLWTTLQSMDRYRGNTTLIITTDHGRGRTPADWAEHDAGIEGSQDIWIAIIGPDTPALGEVRGRTGVTQGDVAATMLQYLGLDHRDFNPDGGPPVPGSLAPAAASTAAN